MAFVFGLKTLWLIDFTKIYQLKGLKPKNKSRTNFYECCDLTEKVYLIYIVYYILHILWKAPFFFYHWGCSPDPTFLHTWPGLWSSWHACSILHILNGGHSTTTVVVLCEAPLLNCRGSLNYWLLLLLLMLCYKK